MSSEHDPAGPEDSGSAEADEPLVRPLDAGDDDAAAGASATPVTASPASADPAASGFGTPVGAGSPSVGPPAQQLDSHNMLPPRDRRHSPIERLFVRLIATCGIVAIGVAIAAIMVSSKSQGWLIGLVVSIVTVVLAAILWSSRQL